MIYGYLRVSTAAQDENNQRSGIVRYADYMQYTIDEWVIEHGISGAKDYKSRKLGLLMRKLVDGDLLIVSEFTRLSRDTFQMYEICKQLVDKGVKVFSVKDNRGFDLSPEGKLMLAINCFFAEKERERIRQRTKEALDAKRKQGIVGGRPKSDARKKCDLVKDYIADSIRCGLFIKDIAENVGVPYSIMERYIKTVLKIKLWDRRKVKYKKCRARELYPQMVELRKLGLPYAEISRRLNFSESAIKQFITNQGYYDFELKTPKQKPIVTNDGVLLLTNQGVE